MVVLPIMIVATAGFTVIPVTWITYTVTGHTAVKLPSTDVTVIFVNPSEIAVTTPELLTDATAGLEECHVTFLLDASEGWTVAVRVTISPAFTLAEEGFTETPVTGIEDTMTCEAAASPFVVVAVITVVPEETAVTCPEELTVATSVLPELHVTLGYEAFAGSTVAVSCCVPPGASVADAGETVTPVTGIYFWHMSIRSILAKPPVVSAVKRIVFVPATRGTEKAEVDQVDHDPVAAILRLGNTVDPFTATEAVRSVVVPLANLMVKPCVPSIRAVTVICR